MKIADQYLNRGTQLGNSDGVNRSKHPDAPVMEKGKKPEAHEATLKNHHNAGGVLGNHDGVDRSDWPDATK